MDIGRAEDFLLSCYEPWMWLHLNSKVSTAQNIIASQIASQLLHETEATRTSKSQTYKPWGLVPKMQATSQKLDSEFRQRGSWRVSNTTRQRRKRWNHGCAGWIVVNE